MSEPEGEMILVPRAMIERLLEQAEIRFELWDEHDDEYSDYLELTAWRDELRALLKEPA